MYSVSFSVPKPEEPTICARSAPLLFFEQPHRIEQDVNALYLQPAGRRTAPSLSPDSSVRLGRIENRLHPRRYISTEKLSKRGELLPCLFRQKLTYKNQPIHANLPHEPLRPFDQVRVVQMENNPSA